MIYCHKRIKIEGMECGETYCMLKLDHEGPCQKAKLVRDRPSYIEQAQEFYRPPESKRWQPKVTD